MTALHLEQTTSEQCDEGPFGPFLSDAERDEYHAFLASMTSVPENEPEPEWVCQLCGKPCDEPGNIHYACGDETPF